MDRDVVIQHQIYFYFHILLAVILLLSLPLDWAIALYFLPAAITWNMGSFINIFGHKNKEPVNNKILAFFVGGEGNHKNHHQNPKKYQFGHGIWDLGGLIIEKIQTK
jgi:fatty-acid desaturase